MTDHATPEPAVTTELFHSSTSWPERFDGDDPTWAVAATDLSWQGQQESAKRSAAQPEATASSPRRTAPAFTPQKPKSL